MFSKYENEPWYEAFSAFIQTGSCKPQKRYIRAVKERLEKLGYQVNVKQKEDGVYLVSR